MKPIKVPSMAIFNTGFTPEMVIDMLFRAPLKTNEGFETHFLITHQFGQFYVKDVLILSDIVFLEVGDCPPDENIEIPEEALTIRELRGLAKSWESLNPNANIFTVHTNFMKPLKKSIIQKHKDKFNFSSN